MSTTDNLEQKARGWYAKEYHIDIDKCGRGHSAHQVCLDLAAFARSLAPPPAKGLSDEEIERLVESISRGGEIPFGAVQQAIRVTLRYVRDNGHLPSPSLSVDEVEQVVKEWCFNWCERVAPDQSDWADLRERLTKAITRS